MKGSVLGAFALALLSAGCSLSTSAESWQPTSGQRCHTLLPDPERETVAAIADTAALAAALSEITFFKVSTGDTALVSIAYDSSGVRELVRFHHVKATEAMAKQIQDTVESYVSPEGHPGLVWAYVIRSDPVHVTNPDSLVECSAGPVSPSQILEALNDVLFPAGPPLEDTDGVVSILVGLDGSAREVRIQRSTGDLRFDRALVEVTSEAKYVPARINGFVIEAWTQMTIKLNRHN